MGINRLFWYFIRAMYNKKSLLIMQFVYLNNYFLYLALRFGSSHFKILIMVWLLTTVIIRLMFTSDIQALLLSKREVNIDSFQELIDRPDITPIVEKNSGVYRILEKVLLFLV